LRPREGQRGSGAAAGEGTRRNWTADGPASGKAPTTSGATLRSKEMPEAPELEVTREFLAAFGDPHYGRVVGKPGTAAEC